MSLSLNIMFAGTPIFAASYLKNLIESKHKIVKVLTQPDSVSGRGKKLTPSPVKILAQSYNLPIYQPQSLTYNNTIDLIDKFKCDIMVVVAYGLIIPTHILNIPYFGCINVHGSLLPRWRGAAPIQRAILAGDKFTGITIMQMDSGLDTGDILNSVSCPINNKDTSNSIYNKFQKIGPPLLLDTLDEIKKGTSKPIHQNQLLATYAAKIIKKEARLNWLMSAVQLERSVRAFNPWPISYLIINDQIVIKIWQVSILDHVNKLPGEIIKSSRNGIEIATINGVLNIEKIQLPGKKIISISDLLNTNKQLFIPGKLLK